MSAHVYHWIRISAIIFELQEIYTKGIERTIASWEDTSKHLWYVSDPFARTCLVLHSLHLVGT